MDEPCTHCGERLASNWIFCARCGAHIERPEPVPQEHEPTPVTGAFTGALFGLIAMPLALIFGIMLCFTGWGVVIGIPIIILALLSPLLGPMIGLGATKGKVL